MQYTKLGQRGPIVSRFCFGTLTASPLQQNLPTDAAARLMLAAWERGVNFFDTAEAYRNYDQLRAGIALIRAAAAPRPREAPTAEEEALPWYMRPESLVIATKSYAYTAGDMRRSIEAALAGLGVDHIGIFLLHEQESALTLRGHRSALHNLLRAREEGLVRAVGISTHAPAAVLAASAMPEIDIIHPLVNRTGLGLVDGTVHQMLSAVATAWARGKGVYAMKALGGGNLAHRVEDALGFVRVLPTVHAVAVGIGDVAELEVDIPLVLGEEVPPEAWGRVRRLRRRLHVEEWCEGCAECVEACHHGALSLVGGRLVVDEAKCVLCGYCAPHCRDFCIKVVSWGSDSEDVGG